MAQQSLGRARILRGNERNFSEDAKRAERDIVGMSNGHTDDVERPGCRRRVVWLRS
jgi:hypothetical protein